MTSLSARRPEAKPNLGPLPGAIADAIAREQAERSEREARRRRERRKAWLALPATKRDIARLRREVVAAIVAAMGGER